MKNFSGFRSKMFTILQVQISVIYKNFESIKCRDFVTELHFAGVKLRGCKTFQSNKNDFVKIRTVGGLLYEWKNMFKGL